MTATEHRSLWIDGKLKPASSATRRPCLNPATGVVWAEVDEAGVEDVDAAVTAAGAAFPGWRRLEPAARGRLLAEWAARIADQVDHLTTLESTGNGKPVRESRGEVLGAAEYLRYYAGLADKVAGEHIPTRSDVVTLTSREPFGVVAGITAWNSPLYQAVRKAAPALAAGNTMVLKPDEHTPVTALELAALATDAGLPDGVLNVVCGGGETVGAALVAHPGVRKVSMTGSGPAAVEITRASATKLIPLAFELGGKSPHIVFADGNVDAALVAAVNGAYGAAGQSCTAGSRIFVERSILSEFTRRFVDAVAGLRVGDPFDPETQIGAITCPEQFEKVQHYVGVGAAEGAELLLGGNRVTEPPFDRGLFFEPTVFGGGRADMEIARTEIFGPVSVLIPFDDEDEVVEAANSVPFGLTAGLWTEDLRRAHRVGRKLEAGVVWVNMFRSVHPSTPYGGTKQSGYGREDGVEGFLAYTQTKSLVIDVEPEHRPDLFGLRGLGVGRTT